MASTSHPPVAASGYPLFGRFGSRSEWISRAVALAAGIGLVYAYRLYLHGGDVAPDSRFGLICAAAGTGLLLLVGLSYVVRKRLRPHGAMRLHTALAWHIAGALVGVLLIFLHAAGNFNPRSGTYALYGLLAVAISGVVGRMIDRLCPRLAAAAALKATTADGSERLEVIEQTLDAAPDRQVARRQAIRRVTTPGVPWDLAYYDLDPEVEMIPRLLGRGSATAVRGLTGAWRAIGPRSGHGLAQRRPLADFAQREAAAVRGALAREQFYLQMIRAWRKVHALTCVVALGLLVWHIGFAVTLYLHAR